MARPSIKELYNVDPSIFNEPAIIKYYEERIYLLIKRRNEVAHEIKKATDYDELSAWNSLYRYIMKALDANEKDLREITSASA